MVVLAAQIHVDDVALYKRRRTHHSLGRVQGVGADASVGVEPPQQFELAEFSKVRAKARRRRRQRDDGPGHVVVEPGGHGRRHAEPDVAERINFGLVVVVVVDFVSYINHVPAGARRE